MNKIHIETLTDVHVGSGETLLENNDYYVTQCDGDKVLAIIDPKKVLNRIGLKNIDTWVAGIERGKGIVDILKSIAPIAGPWDVAKRLVDLYASKSLGSLKTIVRNGLDRPYLPGSSLKGAMRTAVMATVMKNNPNMDLWIDFSKMIGAKVERNVFGSDPNNDIFRFLQVGDADFGEWSTSAVRMVNVNERTSGNYWDCSKQQLIETIPLNCDSYFEMKIRSKECQLAGKKLPPCMTSVDNLFEAINNHTCNLLEQEVKWWADREMDDTSGYASQYKEACKQLLEEALAAKPGQCVMRVGGGSGWRFITGDWSRKSKMFNQIKDKSRPHNERYKKYDFPKSRRVDDECNLLGFVKLSLK